MKAISIDKNILSGTPVFNGTRVPISILFDYLEDNQLDDFFENYPTVSKEQASQVIKLAGKLVNNPQNLDENLN